MPKFGSYGFHVTVLRTPSSHCSPPLGAVTVIEPTLGSLVSVHPGYPPVHWYHMLYTLRVNIFPSCDTRSSTPEPFPARMPLRRMIFPNISVVVLNDHVPSTVTSVPP